jgi:hypothetical protein
MTGIQKDLIKGLVVAVITTMGARVIPTLDAQTLPALAEWGNCAIVGLTAGISYLFKNILTFFYDKGSN